MNFAALVFVTLREVTRQPVADFEAALAEIPQIVEAQRLFGDPDYLLHVVVQDLEHFSRFLLDNLLNASGVADVNSSFVLRAVKTDGGLPLPGA